MSYTLGTFAAFVDGVVPETPGMADRGEEHVPGALDAGLDELLVDEVNALQPASGPFAALGYDTTPLAPIVALLLDVAALELLVRRRAEEGFQSPKDAYAWGPFSRLAPRDRLRAVRMLESEGVFPALADHLDAPGLGTVQYLAGALVALTETLYYGELTGDGERSQGWQQADYPGPSDGYAVMLGYELDAFAEDDY